MKTLTVENKETKLFVSVYPNEKRETIILLHGGPGVPDNLTRVAELLEDNFQIISFHQRGTSLSPCSNRDYSIDSYLTDIDSIARNFNIRKFHLFGHSWGGLYAQIYAEKHPANILSLFLCSPGSGTGRQWQETEKEVMKFNNSKCSFSELLGLGYNSLRGRLGNDRAYQKLFEQVIKNYNKGFTITDVLTFDLQSVKAVPINLTRKELLKYPLLKNVPDPLCKVTVTYGTEDIYGDSKKYVKERFPTAEFITIENCGHLPWFHNMAAFQKVLYNHFKI
jgi:proline iminopeptidase